MTADGTSCATATMPASTAPPSAKAYRMMPIHIAISTRQ